MRSKNNAKYVRRTILGLALVAGFGLAAPLEAAPKNNKLNGGPTPITQEILEKISEEGPLELRQEYFQQHRLKLGDLSFDTAGARLRALELRDLQRKTVTPPLPQTGSTWTFIGPDTMTGGQTPQDFAQASPVTGRIVALAIDSTLGFTFAGAAGGGLWRSANNGATWTPLTDNLLSLATGSVALDPTTPTTVYLGTGEGNGSADSYAGVGIYKSINSGTTWTGPFGGALFQGRGVNSIAVDRTNPLILNATSANGQNGNAHVIAPGVPFRGIFRSTDAGLTWTRTTSAADNRASIVIQDPRVAARWYAGSWFTAIGAGVDDGGLLVSTDGGATWTQFAGATNPAGCAAGPTGLPAANLMQRVWVTATAAAADLNTTLYLGDGEANTAPTQAGRIYKSVDSGCSWVELPSAKGFCAGQCFYDMPVTAEPLNTGVVYHGGAGAVDTVGGPNPRVANMRRSTDGGTTWTDIMRSAPTTALHSDTHQILVKPGTPTEIWTGDDGGVWRSIDKGTTWTNQNTNLGVVEFVGFDLDPSTPGRAYGGTQDNGTNGWSGSTLWPHLDFGDGGFALIDQVTPSNLVHTYFNQTNNLIGVGFTTAGFTTTQGGYSTSTAPGNGILLTDRVLFYAPIHLDRGSVAAGHTLYFGTHKLYRCSTFFTTPNAFAALAAGADLSGGAPAAISAIETFANPTPGTNATIIYTGSSTGRVFRSTDSGATFTNVDLAGRFVADVLVDPANSANVWTALSGFAGGTGLNVRRSTDSGATWAAAGSGIPDIPVNAIAIDNTQIPPRIWAGTDVGVYVCLNSNAATPTWAVYGTGLPNVAISDLKLNSVTGQLVAATYGRGMWRITPLTPATLTKFDAE